MVVDQIIDTPDQVMPRQALGGAPSYSSLGLSSLGYRPEIVTHVGDDFPPKYAELIKERSGILLDKWVAHGFRTTSYRIDRSGPRRSLWLAARCQELSLNDFAPFLSDAGLRSIVLNPVAGEIRLELLHDIAARYGLVFADSQGFVRSFDEKTGEVGMKSGVDITRLDGVDVLKADSEELTAWTGISSKESAIEEISQYVDIVLMTSGPSRVEVYQRAKLSLVASPFKVSVADTTGAGDIMLSSFAARFTETGNLKNSLAFSLTASTLAVQRYGVEKAILLKEEVESRLTDVQMSG
jgi:sugar/nucleoside kinase (ribokinase family)